MNNTNSVRVKHVSLTMKIFSSEPSLLCSIISAEVEQTGIAATSWNRRWADLTSRMQVRVQQVMTL